MTWPPSWVVGRVFVEICQYSFCAVAEQFVSNSSCILADQRKPVVTQISCYYMISGSRTRLDLEDDDYARWSRASGSHYGSLI